MNKKWKEANEYGELDKSHWKLKRKKNDFPWRNALITICILAIVAAARVAIFGEEVIVERAKRIHKYTT
jgi:hypothetical protein